MKLIMESWRKYQLLESAEGGFGELAGITHYTSYGGGMKFFILYSPPVVRECLSNGTLDHMRGKPEEKYQKLFVDKIIKGVVSIKRPHKESSGNCNGAWTIDHIAHDGTKGIGYNILYPAAFEMAAPADVTPDRYVVKPGARATWNRIFQEKNRKITPFDNFNAHDQFGYSKFDHPNHTSDPDDDCTVHGEDYLDASYSANSGDNKKNELLSNHEYFMSEIRYAEYDHIGDPLDFQDEFELNLVKYENLFFQKQFLKQ